MCTNEETPMTLLLAVPATFGVWSLSGTTDWKVANTVLVVAAIVALTVAIDSTRDRLS